MNNYVIALPNSDKYRRVEVGMDWYKVSTNNLEHVVVDGEDKCCFE